MKMILNSADDGQKKDRGRCLGLTFLERGTYRMKTKTILIEDLLTKPQTPARDELIVLARRGVYHDFETTIATPKMQLRRDLLAAGFEDLANKVVEGYYD